jgi:toxin ParE1/3/4
LPPSSSVKLRSVGEYRLTPRAQRDLDGVFEYGVAQWGLAQALRYRSDRVGLCRDADAPLRGQDCAHIRAGNRRRSVGEHLLYFRATGYGIAVVDPVCGTKPGCVVLEAKRWLKSGEAV